MTVARARLAAMEASVAPLAVRVATGATVAVAALRAVMVENARSSRLR